MKLLVIGLGYVGLANALAFSGHHEVVGLDPDTSKIESLNKGIAPLMEDGFQKALEEHPIEVHSSFDELNGRVFDAAILCLPTPSKNDGSCDISYLVDAVIDLENHGIGYSYLVLRSTAVMDTPKIIEEKAKRPGVVISNPEFLSQSTAYEDEINPKRIVIGTSTKEAENFAKALYKYQIDKGIPVIFTDNVSAQLGKYASNAFLALKISFINEISRLSEATGGDVRAISKIMGLDPRIAPAMLQAGLGYGGGCFPKDVLALIDEGKKRGLDLEIEKASAKTNVIQRQRFLDAVVEALGPQSGKKVALLGLSFKKNTPDVRRSLSVFFATGLLRQGFSLIAYDNLHEAKKEFNKAMPIIKVASTLDEALDGADAIVILNDDPKWSDLTQNQLLGKMKGRHIFDGRNMLDKKDFPEFIFRGIGY